MTWNMSCRLLGCNHRLRYLSPHRGLGLGAKMVCTACKHTTSDWAEAGKLDAPRALPGLLLLAIVLLVVGMAANVIVKWGT